MTGYTNIDLDIFSHCIMPSMNLLKCSTLLIILNLVLHFRNIRPNVAILDECHLIKGSKTARTKAAEMVLKNCARIILCSGTPALSRPIELYSQINLIDPKLFPYVTDFGMRYCEGKKVNFGPNKSHYDFQGNDGRDTFLVMSSVYYDRTCLWSADIFTSVWQENLLFL